MVQPEEHDGGAIDVVSRAIAELWEAGCPVARDSKKLATIAVRRWRSVTRRAHNASISARIEDLVKGLIEQCEPDPRLVGPLRRDYEYLAEQISPLLAKATREGVE